MKPKHPGGRPPSKHPPLVAIAFKADKEVEDAIEYIRSHLNKSQILGAVEVHKSQAMRYAILTTKKAIQKGEIR